MAETDKSAVPTLYEWAGGMQTFETLFDKFYNKVLADAIP
jgi:hemoglobin